ncbi:hypothetical protein E2C01_092717 [Portunus trituberculatus]|uniref:Uncharacterized protein n=1 Tax=Portunus trituberculatus TaxID=210409 RepID=A0A5B7JMS7_PORTR|nr:hypothetical protein [Portunus trituberculatus]
MSAQEHGGTREISLWIIRNTWINISRPSSGITERGTRAAAAGETGTGTGTGWGRRGWRGVSCAGVLGFGSWSVR